MYLYARKIAQNRIYIFNNKLIIFKCYNISKEEKKVFRANFFPNRSYIDRFKLRIESHFFLYTAFRKKKPKN